MGGSTIGTSSSCATVIRVVTGTAASVSRATLTFDNGSSMIGSIPSSEIKIVGLTIEDLDIS